MKKYCSLLLLICGILTFYSCSKEIDNSSEAENRISLNAETLLSNLMKSFNMEVRSNSNGQSIYPDYYGGCYLDESKNLVILVTGNDSSLHEEDLILRCGGNGFNMKLCKHSYNYLTSLIYSLEDKWKEADPNNEMKYYGICTNQKENKLIINTGDISENNKKKFIELLDGFQDIDFILSSEIVYQSDINPGMGMAGAVVGSNYSAGSVGYRAKSGTTSVIVVSGHVMKAVDTNLRDRNRNIMGKCTKVQWKEIPGSKVDAAICTVNTGYSLSNVVKLFSGSVTLKAEIANVTQYSPIKLKGFHSESSGSVIATDYHLPNSNMYNFIKAGYRSVNGDSGGICYTDEGKVVGIHQGALPENGTENTIIVPAGQINDAFNLTMY